MNVRLIPVIEIFRPDDSIPSPGKGPSWEYPDEWSEYNRLLNIKAGFSDKLAPYQKGSRFYKIDEIKDEDLLVIIQLEIEKQKGDDEPLVLALTGGYILQVNGDNVYFPQCCGDLANIGAWYEIINGAEHPFFAGHPSPKISVTGEMVHFDFVNTNYSGEHFTPPPSEKQFQLKLSDLKHALDVVTKELKIFGSRLRWINEIHGLNIQDIDRILISSEI
ncbi:hypothetical protein [Taibaiella soli]|uniref:Uncharacterized protein n=1 Tax=Taibaiella soli TaxID=1649169 RepID=A0A2W2AGV0_9BACT|nr:hypothetical protein [Taibaiella soli]PZF74501.1 hypothetical protein DN068_02685 [Taibaiella soli]